MVTEPKATTDVIPKLRDRIEQETASLMRYVHFNRDRVKEAKLEGRIEAFREAIDLICIHPRKEPDHAD